MASTTDDPGTTDHATPADATPDAPSMRTAHGPSQPPIAPRSSGGRPVVPADLAAIRLLGDPSISPDGKRVAAAVTTTSVEKDCYSAAIWLFPTDGGEPSQLTSGSKRDASPRWSPDGSRLLFTSNRDTDAPNLWVISLDGGEARRVTDRKTGVGDPVWAPDGRRVALVSPVEPEDPNPGSDAKVIRDIRYKFDGQGFLGGKRSHLFVVDVDAGSEPEQVTAGPFNHSAPVWSPTGRELAFAANRNPGWETERTNDVWTVVPGAAPKRLTDGHGQYGAPAWSPDGRSIAFLGTDDMELEAPDDDLWVLPAGGGTARNLTRRIRPPDRQRRDRRYGRVRFAPAGLGAGRTVSAHIDRSRRHLACSPDQRPRDRCWDGHGADSRSAAGRRLLGRPVGAGRVALRDRDPRSCDAAGAASG